MVTLESRSVWKQICLNLIPFVNVYARRRHPRRNERYVGGLFLTYWMGEGNEQKPGIRTGSTKWGHRILRGGSNSSFLYLLLGSLRLPASIWSRSLESADEGENEDSSQGIILSSFGVGHLNTQIEPHRRLSDGLHSDQR